MIKQSRMTVSFNITPRNDKRSESELALPTVQESLEPATDYIHNKNIAALDGKRAGSLTPRLQAHSPIAHYFSSRYKWQAVS
jgi:hypothetical protein